MIHLDPEWLKKTDEDLIRISLTHRDAFAVLVERYQAKLKRYVLRISDVGSEEADDLLQEIFIKIYKNLNGFDPEQKCSSWVYRIAHNTAVSHYRKRNARPEGHLETGDESLLERLASETDISKDVEARERTSAVQHILSLMDPKYREILILKFLEEKDYHEISFILKKPMGTVATLIHRAKKQFKDIAKSHPSIFHTI